MTLVLLNVNSFFLSHCYHYNKNNKKKIEQTPPKSTPETSRNI
jgi:hypothetical protein